MVLVLCILSPLVYDLCMNNQANWPIHQRCMWYTAQSKPVCVRHMCSSKAVISFQKVHFILSSFHPSSIHPLILSYVTGVASRHTERVMHEYITPMTSFLLRLQHIRRVKVRTARSISNLRFGELISIGYK